MKRSKFYLAMLCIIAIMLFGACSEQTPDANANDDAADNADKPTIQIADPSWPEDYFLNGIAKIIITEGYGYPAEYVTADMAVLIEAMTNQEVDVHLDVWKNGYAPYQPLVEEGKLVEVGTLNQDAVQGYYVPTYLITGDADRGIEASCPDLQHVKDLAQYWQVFQDPEDPDKGIIYSGAAGSLAAQITEIKFETYGLSEYFNITAPGSQAAIDASLVAAYEKGEAWVGYGYVPSAVVGKYDVTLLADEPYSDELYTEEAGYACEYPVDEIVIAASTDLQTKAPDVFEFLSKMQVSGADISEALAIMDDEGLDGDQIALRWMQENPTLWQEWVTEEAAQAILAAIEE